MTKWEYKVKNTYPREPFGGSEEFEHEFLMASMNRMGEDGWEVVSEMSNVLADMKDDGRPPSSLVFLFKRPKTD